MNNLRICIGSHFVFDGFTVQPGMLYGHLNTGKTVITNGQIYKGGYWVYISSGEIFQRIHINKESRPQLFTKVESAIRRRERKQIGGVSYRTPAQLEFERWDKDPDQKFFMEAITPNGKSKKRCEFYLGKK